MIHVSRSATPRILEQKADKWTTDLQAADTEAKRKKAESKYRHRQVKAALVAMFHGKCAYCESKITHIDYGHIEHYRPKRGSRGRPDLTFAWENLVLACGVCNGPAQKGDHFPEPAEDGPILNPCIDIPAEHLEFHYDPKARVASVYGKTPRGVTTEQLIGLNRPELRRYRSRRVSHLMALARLARSDTEAIALLDEAKNAEAEYSAFAELARNAAGD
jgi:uncharacterized protein (TIGR02646 family)